MEGKKGARYRDIPSVTTLSPEECIERLQNLIEYGIRVEVKQEDEDVYRFDAEMWEDNLLIGRAEGSLTRWEGTSTRLKFDSKLTESQKRGINRMRWLIPFLLTMFGVGLSVYQGLDFNDAVVLVGVIFLLSLIPGLIIRTGSFSRDSDELMWVLSNTLDGKPLTPEPRIRSVEELGLDEEKAKAKKLSG